MSKILAPLFFILIITGSFFYQQDVNYPELTDIRSHSRTFTELQEYFKNIAEKKGALYAFEILRRAQLPPQTDVHLLGHTVGDKLYEEYGKEAIQYCTNEFRNACSHTVVVGLLLDFGPSALDDISEACKKAPGGPGAYSMCFHGLGHGVLAYEQYDLKKTVALCRKTGTPEHRFEEFQQCVGGAIMESISGGGHNRAAWEKARPAYLSKTDPLSPCNKDFIPKEVRSYCYVYLTPHLVEAADGDMNNPDPAVFPKAFSFCRALPESDRNRRVCFSSFGKEFVGWARTSDGRDITTLTEEELRLMTSWCALAGSKTDTHYCLQGIQQYIYWGGENDPKQSVRYCIFLGTNKLQTEDKCFSDLINLVSSYVRDAEKRAEICALFPEDKKEECASAKIGGAQPVAH